MHFPWSQSLTAKTPEIKLAGIIASVASLATILIIIWSADFVSDQEVIDVASSSTIHVVNKPNMAQTSPPLQDSNYATANSSPAVSSIKTATTVAQKPIVTSKEIVRHAPTKKTKRIVIGRGHFYVQVGAYQQQKLARLMFEKMKRKYKRAKIIAKGKVHAVWVGPVQSRKEAEQLKNRLQRLDHLRGFITSDK